MKTTFQKCSRTQRRFLWYAATVTTAFLLATQTLAGTLTVVGNVTVATNLTAQSITLGGVTQTSWPSGDGLPLQGYKYVIVPEGTNDVHRGNNLRTAYTTATTLGPAVTNHVTVIVPPGAYNLGSSGLVMNTGYVDLIGLVPCQMTTKQIFMDAFDKLLNRTVANVQYTVKIYAAASSGSGTVVQNVDNVRIESVTLSNTSTGVAYYPTVSGTNTVLRHVSMPSMRAFEYAGEYIDCVSGNGSFGGTASGTFVDCVGGNDSFGSGGAARGSFTDCAGGDSSFANGGEASGTFTRCTGGYECFGTGDGGSTGGKFVDCVAGDNSFADFESSAAGEFIGCVGGVDSFGSHGGSVSATAKLQHCKAGVNSFGDFNMASEDFNYNVGGTNTFLMLPQLPTSAVGLPSGSVWSSNGVLRVTQ